MDVHNTPIEITHRTPKEFLEQYKKDLVQCEKALAALKESFTKLRESGEKATLFIRSKELKQIASCFEPGLHDYNPRHLWEPNDQLVPSKVEEVTAAGTLCIQAIENGCTIIQQRRELLRLRGKRDETNVCMKLAEAAYAHLE
jgi:hypothetical protein